MIPIKNVGNYSVEFLLEQWVRFNVIRCLKAMVDLIFECSYFAEFHTSVKNGTLA